MELVKEFALDPKGNEKPLMGLFIHIFNSWLSNPLTWLS